MELKRLPPGEASLPEQNNAMEYLADSLPEQTGEATKGRFLMLLTRPRSEGQKNKTEI